MTGRDADRAEMPAPSPARDICRQLAGRRRAAHHDIIARRRHECRKSSRASFPAHHSQRWAPLVMLSVHGIHTK